MMARNRAGADVHGLVLLDKPAGVSSNRAVQEVRRLFRARKAGHTGSLDPFATGMLAICLGEASKTAAFMLEADKSYRATACLGRATETGDPEGAVTEERPPPELDEDDVERVLSRFRGPMTQVPPMYSALKQGGQPLYRLARQGIEVERQAREVFIRRLDLVGWERPHLRFEVTCSKGTYIRTLAQDIAAALGTCGHLIALRRLAIAPFLESGMVTLEALQQAAAAGRASEFLLSADAGVQDWPVVRLADDAAERFRHGNPAAVGIRVGLVRVHSEGGQILGLGEVREDGLLYPRRVFIYAADRSGNT